MPGDGAVDHDAINAALLDPRKKIAAPAEEVSASGADDAKAGTVDVEAEETTETPDEETGGGKADDVQYLKSRLGKQSQEVGQLRREKAELERLLTARNQPVAEPKKDVAVEEFQKKYSPEFGADLQGFIRSQLLPIQAELQITRLRSEFSDFDEMTGEMDAVISESEGMAAIVQQNLSSLRDVYLIAKARKGLDTTKVERRVAAEVETKEREKRAAISERPGKSVSKEEPAPTPEEINRGLAMSIATANQPGRSF